MALRIFATARKLFATKGIDWSLDAARCAVPASSYVPDMELHSSVSLASPLLAEVALTAQGVALDGWLTCAPISILNVPSAVSIQRVLFYRILDGLLLFDMTFPAIVFTVTSNSLFIQQASDAKGLCRL